MPEVFMGGIVNIVIKDLKGEIHKLETHTAKLNCFFYDYYFFKKNEKHITDFISQYCKPASFSPLSPYGIIYVDFTKNKVISSQDYCKFHYIFLMEIYNIFYNCLTIEEVQYRISTTLSSGNETEIYFLNNFQKLFINDFLSYCTHYSSSKDYIVDCKKESFESFIFNTMLNRDYQKAYIKNSNFTYTYYDCDDIGQQIKMKSDFIKEGVVFSSEEEAEWDEHLINVLELLEC